MKFKGSIEELMNLFNLLIVMYGPGAKVVDIERSVRAVRSDTVWRVN